MFKPGFWIHSEILTHLRILWSQRIGVLSRFWARILDFGFWLFGSSDRGSQHSPGNLAFSLLCDGCHAVEKMTRYNNALKHDGSVRPWFTEVSYCSVLSRVAMATSLNLLFFLVSAGFCFDTDVGYLNISLIFTLNAKTQYHARQLQQLKSLCI